MMDSFDNEAQIISSVDQDSQEMDDQLNRIAQFCQYCTEGNISSAKEFLEEHSEILNYKDISGYTALHWASLHDRKEIVEWLISIGGDLLAQGPNEETPFHLAAQGGSLYSLPIIAESIKQIIRLYSL